MKNLFSIVLIFGKFQKHKFNKKANAHKIQKFKSNNKITAITSIYSHKFLIKYFKLEQVLKS